MIRSCKFHGCSEIKAYDDGKLVEKVFNQFLHNFIPDDVIGVRGVEVIVRSFDIQDQK